MKILICTLAFAIQAVSVLSQANNGKWSAGANLSYNHSGTNSKGDLNSTAVENSYTIGHYDIRFGYFLSDNFIIGLKGIYSTYKSLNTYDEPLGSYSNENNSTDVGLFCRYYHMFKESKFGWFGELNATYTMGTINSETLSHLYGNTYSDGDLTGYKVSVLPGIVYFASSKIAFETTFGLFSYTNSTTKYVRRTEPATQPENKWTEETNYFMSNLSFNSISLGVSYYFGAGKK